MPKKVPEKPVPKQPGDEVDADGFRDLFQRGGNLTVDRKAAEHGAAAGADHELDTSGLDRPAKPRPKGGPPTAVDHRSGHRQRLRKRFLKGGVDGVQDYELLELILFRAIPRRDVKPLAKSLLSRFRSFAEVIHAPEHLLREVDQVSDAVVAEIKIVRAAALHMMRTEVIEQPVLSSWNEVLHYCRAAMGYDTREQFRILFLDKKNKLIADEVQGQGTVDHTPVYIREVVKRALELSSTALILVHNHPSGDTRPSRADIDMTRMIQSAALPLGITLHDHIIVGRGVHTSFRSEGLL